MANTRLRKLLEQHPTLDDALDTLADLRASGPVSTAAKEHILADAGVDPATIPAGTLRRWVAQRMERLGLKPAPTAADYLNALDDEGVDDLIAQWRLTSFEDVAEAWTKSGKPISASTLCTFIHSRLHPATRETLVRGRDAARRRTQRRPNHPIPERGVWEIDTATLKTKVRVLDPTHGYEAHNIQMVAVVDSDRTALHARLVLRDAVNKFEAVDVLLEAIAKYGAPYTINIDEGSEYNNWLFYSVCQRFGIAVNCVGPDNPTAKEAVENLNGLIQARCRRGYAGSTATTGFGDKHLFGGSTTDAPSVERVTSDLQKIVDRRQDPAYQQRPLRVNQLAKAVALAHTTWVDAGEPVRSTLDPEHISKDCTIQSTGIRFRGVDYDNLDHEPEPGQQLSPERRISEYRYKRGNSTVRLLPYPGDSDRRIAYGLTNGKYRFLAVVTDVRLISIDKKTDHAARLRAAIRRGEDLQMHCHEVAVNENKAHDRMTGHLGLVKPNENTTILVGRIAQHFGVAVSEVDYIEDTIQVDGRAVALDMVRLSCETRYGHLCQVPDQFFIDWRVARPGSRHLRIQTPTWQRTVGNDGKSTYHSSDEWAVNAVSDGR